MTGRKNVYLLLHNAHFSTILYPLQAFEYRYQCQKCASFFNNKGEHKCEGSCWRSLLKLVVDLRLIVKQQQFQHTTLSRSQENK